MATENETQYRIQRLINSPMESLYGFWQAMLSRLLSPVPPPPGIELKGPRIAVIGAGITGVSAAAHCVGHGFETVIFEAGDENALGGIWSKVNNTSGLQIHSIMYRFHPHVRWTTGYPDRRQIISQVTELWHYYGLQNRTRFNTTVDRVYKDEKGKWIINDPENGQFDGVLACIGTCGDPKVPFIPGKEKFQGEIYHSGQLTGKNAEGKRVIVIGGGASAVESLEFVAHENAAETNVLARSEKWIIPRNAVVDMLLALNIFGQEGLLSWIPEDILRLFFYRDLSDLAPPQGGTGIYQDTPMVNDEVFELIRAHKVQWLRGDILRFEEEGVVFRKRAQGVPKNGPGRELLVKGDICILATGYHRPSMNFLPENCFDEPYAPPNWYLQVFPPTHYDICANNCTYVNAIGTVGNFHIGIYTRLLLMYIVDPFARPREKWAKRWINYTKWMKHWGPVGAFDFFTYSELIYWFVFTLLVNPFRWKWALFVMFGVGADLPMRVVDEENKFRKSARNGMGQRVS